MPIDILVHQAFCALYVHCNSSFRTPKFTDDKKNSLYDCWCFAEVDYELVHPRHGHVLRSLLHFLHWKHQADLPI